MRDLITFNISYYGNQFVIHFYVATIDVNDTVQILCKIN